MDARAGCTIALQCGLAVTEPGRGRSAARCEADSGGSRFESHWPGSNTGELCSGEALDQSSASASPFMYSFGASLWAVDSASIAFDVNRHSPLSMRRSCFSLIPVISLGLSPACSRTFRTARP